MALKLINENAVPAYLALSTDIINNKIEGASLVGKTILMTDTADWYIIKEDLTISEYALPVNIVIAGDVEIGAVELKDAITNNRASINSSGALLVDVPSITISGVSTSDNQTSGSQKTQLVDALGVNFNIDNPLDTVNRVYGSLDENNSTTTPLSAGGVFTGLATNISEISSISLMVYSDVETEAGGLWVEFSANGVDWHEGEKYTVPANTSKFFTPPCQSLYYRVIYHNNGSNQTVFHLHATLRSSPIKWSSHNINEPISNQDDAELTKSVLTGKEFDTGVFHNVGVQEYVDGEFYLQSAMVQGIYPDPNNSSITNLTSSNSYTFSGSPTSTLGVTGLQWSLKTDKNATVYVDQSPDGINWDINYEFDYIASKGGQGETVQATQAYWRLRVVLTGTEDTSYFRLNGILAPMANPLPSSLTDDGRLSTETTITGRENTERHVFISPLNSMTTNTTVRLVGTSFDGAIKDTNFWTETIANGGSVVQGGGEVVLSTGVSATGSSKYQTVHRARYVVSRPLKFFGYFAFGTALVANNLRRLGTYDADNGFFYQINGTTFSIGTRKGGVDSLVSSGSFNGWYGSTWQPSADETYYRFEIEYGAIGVSFYLNGRILHSLKLKHLTNTLTFPITMENINSGSTVTSLLDSVGAAIIGQGEYLTSPISKYIGASGTTILKQNAGILHRVTVTDNAGTLLVYDGLSAAGTLIANLDASKTVGTMTFEAPFSTGLTVVSGGSPKMTIIYE